MTSTDNEIIQGLKKNDKKALTKLYDIYWKPLFISSYNLLRDKEVCEEIIQDVFIDIWSKRSQLQVKVTFKSYLYACVRYKVFSEFRKNKMIRVELLEDLDKRFQYATPETQIMHKELEKNINLVVEGLPKKCRQIYKLSRNENLSHKEIATQLNISTKTVENHITNALRSLRASLGDALSFLL